jgi:hypothetical protein
VSALQCSTYLTAVTGYPASAEAGEAIVTTRLEALDAAIAAQTGEPG